MFVLSFGRLSASVAVEEHVRRLLNASALAVFGADYCPYCRQVETALKAAGLEHATHVLSDAERTALRHLTGQRTIPYVFVHGTFIGGCNDGPEPWMGTLPLLRSGRLQAMLERPPAASAASAVPASPPPTPSPPEQVAVIGSGVAALTAAIYLARANRSPLVLAGAAAEVGGQLMLTAEVDNFPGFPDGISGPDLIARMRQQAEKFGARFIHERAVAVEKPTAQLAWRLRTDSGGSMAARAVVVGTGASARWLGLPGEDRLRGRHLHTCARCDGPLYRGAHVVVVGGGDSAASEALLLSRTAASVTLVHRRASFRAGARLLAAVRNSTNIRVRAPAEVSRWVVDDSSGELQAVELRVISVSSASSQTDAPVSAPVDSPATAVERVAVSGAFIAVGHEPATKFLPPSVEIDEYGYVRLHARSMTNAEGIFACGDTADPRYRQAVTAAGAGAQAALDADEWLTDTDERWRSV